MQGSPQRNRNRLQEAMNFLAECGWVEAVGGREGDTGGRQRKDYEVNPKVYSE